MLRSIQQAPKALRVSQLELSVRVGVSQRHLSFAESSRARPSRELLLAWLEELDLPLVVAGGFCARVSRTPLHDLALGRASHALACLLDAS